MNTISNKLLRVLLFAVLLPGILLCAASLLFSAADLLFWIQQESYSLREILCSLVIRTVDGLCFLPVLLLFLAVCLGLRSGKRMQALYTASLICTVLLAVAGMLTDFLTDGIPPVRDVLRQSLVFVPLMLVTADTLVEHHFLIPARLGAPVMVLLCGLRLWEMFPADRNDFAVWTDGTRRLLALVYWLAVTLIVCFQIVRYSRAVRRKVEKLEEFLAAARRSRLRGELSEEEYQEKKAQVMKYL